jgi:hypothetical protein
MVQQGMVQQGMVQLIAVMAESAVIPCCYDSVDLQCHP